jgi:hypothetical protein
MHFSLLVGFFEVCQPKCIKIFELLHHVVWLKLTTISEVPAACINMAP